MSNVSSTWRLILRLSQIAIALIPLIVGILALLNDITDLNNSIDRVVKPLISMQSQSSQTWRALPLDVACYVYIAMFSSEFLVGVISFIGIMNMLKHINHPKHAFEQVKLWIYLACSLGIFIWGLLFFEVGGDWFLAWRNANLISFQRDSLMYMAEMAVTFFYLKAMRY